MPGKNTTDPTASYPDYSYSEIIPMTLYMGGMTAWFFMTQDGIPYDNHFHCAMEVPPGKLPGGRWVKLDDENPITQGTADLAEAAAREVIRLVRQRRTVLVSCIEGLNRDRDWYLD